MKLIWCGALACAMTAQAQLPRRIQFGAALAEVPDSLHQAGALVTSVIEGSPAAVAGVHAGDIIVRLAGDSVRSVANALAALRPLTAGQKVSVTAPDSDYCEGMSYVSYLVVGALDLRDREILEPVVDTSGQCALGPVMLALSYAANQDFLSSWSTIRTPDARIAAAIAATSRARQWWRDYLHDHPDGDWRPAARSGLVARGYPLTSKGFLDAVSDTSRIVRYNAYRLLNATYNAHADLDAIFGFGYLGSLPPAEAVASDTTLRNYWRRRLQGH